VQPSDSLKQYAAAGWITLALFFGVFGVWSLTAPLNGAVVAPAVVKVDGNRKSVQHLDGGIVKNLTVKEGDRVNGGDVLIVLDDTAAQANFEVLSQQYKVLRAAEARLTAEFNGETEFAPPLNMAVDEKGIWEAQRRQFASQQAAIEGQRRVLQEKIQQLKAQITGDENQISAFEHESASVHQELATISPLVDKGLIAQSRRTQLQRTGYGLDGQIAETTADMARSRQGIAEQMQQIAQIDNQHMTDVTKELQDTQAKLLDVIPRLSDAKAVLDRTLIRSPYTGRVVGLNVFGVGSVIGKGEKILDIVPENDGLTVESRIAVEDISDVHRGMRAEVHLTAYKQRITPVINGNVTGVSADRLTDERTGQPYYNALVQVDQQELSKFPSIQLYPGMPAMVQIPTVDRTAFDYIVGPLTASFTNAFRQK
jgi:HlyD family type I secretion membrane fusion protein